MTGLGSYGTVRPDGPGPSYASTGPSHPIRRVKLALFLSSLAACLSVSLIGGISLALLQMLFGLLGISRLTTLTPSLTGGLQTGLQLATLNFVLFIVTVPAAWLALGLSIGRMPHRGIAAKAPYVRWATIWGAILVGATTGGLGLMQGAVSGFGALLSGASVGALAGACCGLLFYAIVRPGEQLSNVDVSVF